MYPGTFRPKSPEELGKISVSRMRCTGGRILSAPTVGGPILPYIPMLRGSESPFFQGCGFFPRIVGADNIRPPLYHIGFCVFRQL